MKEYNLLSQNKDNSFVNTALFWEMDNRLMRRWNQDPKANLWESPYAVYGNNPILNVDVDGDLPWTIHVRSFISSPTVGGGLFMGDHRGLSLSTDKNITSRVRSYFIVDPAKRMYTQPTTSSSVSVFFGLGTPLTTHIGPTVDKGDPDASVGNVNFANNKASFDFSHSGKDPITPGFVTPSLDVHASIVLGEDLEKGVLNVKGEFTGDGFPSTEAFIVDQSGKGKVFLGGHKEKGGVLNLYRDNKKPLFRVDMQIQIDKDGNFTGVKEGKRTYSVEEWNDRVQKKFKSK